MDTILVATDFSESSINAMNYACAFAKDNNCKIALVHIYTIPSTYTGEGLSLATVNDALSSEKDMLQLELDRVHTAFPDVQVDGQMMIGGFLESLQELNKELSLRAIVMGANMEYSDLTLWDSDWLNALITVTCPILVVPPHITYKPVKHIALACDYKSPCLPEQVKLIKNIVKTAEGQLYIVHVTPKASLVDTNKNVATVRQAFDDVKPEYHVVEDKYVIKGVSDFVKTKGIDLLIVIPHKHGLWYSLFNKSYTKQLANLNHLPVLAIHD
ncbi:MAG: universal stress protein [Bacteroidetes bacterium]|nr:universal stress protein [Bacteroidota bacterium]